MRIHIVQKGDTVWKIARQYGVSPQRVISDNSIANPYNLPVGQALIILIPETVYTVRPGDTPASIASQFGITVIELLQNNPTLTVSPPIRPGQVLIIRFQGEKRRQIFTNAYAYPYIPRNTLVYALPFLSALTIFGYGFTVEGDLIGINDQPLINLAYQYKTAPVMLISSITEDGNFSGERASLLFSDPALQDRVLDQIEAIMLEKGYLGLDIDFEYIQPEDRDGFIRFIDTARQRLNPHGFFVNTDLAPKTSGVQRGLLYEAHDYPAIGEVSNTVLLMTYEWGYTYGPPMAVAPLNKVREVVSYAASVIPPDKILLGIPNYGYDWPLPFERGVTSATSIGNDYAVELAARFGAEIQYDEASQSPFFEYYRPGGVKHVVWFEDVRSIMAKYDLADEFNLLGAGYWNAMRPFNQNWAFLGAAYDIKRIVQ